MGHLGEQAPDAEEVGNSFLGNILRVLAGGCPQLLKVRMREEESERVLRGVVGRTLLVRGEVLSFTTGSGKVG